MNKSKNFISNESDKYEGVLYKVFRYKNREKPLPSINALKKICGKFSITITEFINFVDTMREKR